MTKKEIGALAVQVLEERYPDALCSLTFNREKPYELLFAVRLSAQCTDARVNLVTPVLFERYPTLQDIANADLAEMESIVHPCGFYHAKATSIIACAKVLLEKYNGAIPSTMEELTALPGIGRKTANLMLGDIFHQPAYVCDTHMIRIAGRLGLTKSKDPVQVEKDIRPVIAPEKSSEFCHRVVLFGRDVCSARKPDCQHCPIHAYAMENNVTICHL